MSTQQLTQFPVNILVVEDSEDQKIPLVLAVFDAGCQVTSVESAEQAIAALAELELDLAVIDLILPGMNGWELLERIRTAHPSCAVAITSVLDSASYPVSDAALPKPVSRVQVQRVLEQCVPRWAA